MQEERRRQRGQILRTERHSLLGIQKHTHSSPRPSAFSSADLERRAEAQGSGVPEISAKEALSTALDRTQAQKVPLWDSTDAQGFFREPSVPVQSPQGRKVTTTCHASPFISLKHS